MTQRRMEVISMINIRMDKPGAYVSCDMSKLSSVEAECQFITAYHALVDLYASCHDISYNAAHMMLVQNAANTQKDYEAATKYKGADGRKQS